MDHRLRTTLERFLHNLKDTERKEFCLRQWFWERQVKFVHGLKCLKLLKGPKVRGEKRRRSLCE